LPPERGALATPPIGAAPVLDKLRDRE
jgi:hypothetical protein